MAIRTVSNGLAVRAAALVPTAVGGLAIVCALAERPAAPKTSPAERLPAILRKSRLVSLFATLVLRLRIEARSIAHKVTVLLSHVVARLKVKKKLV